MLLRKGKRTEVKTRPATYAALKNIAHIPLALYTALGGPEPPAELTADRRKELERYREQVRRVKRALDGLALDKATLARQQQIVAASLQFLDGVLEAGKVDAAALAKFARGTGDLLLANAAAAAAAQLEALHKQVTTWKADMTDAEWKRLRVLILGSALPRQGNVNTQYFARLLGQSGEGGRLLYAEGIFDEARALNLLATAVLDGHIGRAFFGDERRMHRDLLGDGAEAHLKKMKVGP